MSLVVLPAPLEAACDMFAHPDLDPCESCLADVCGDCDCSDETAHETAHETEGCCETGCQHCSLPCCSGTAMIPPFAQVLDTSLTSDGRLAATVTDVTWVDPDPLYHPPRA